MPESTRSSTLADGVWSVILAGGIGSRFWPASTEARPKQLLPLASTRPLIVDTVERARAYTRDDRLRILAGAHLAEPFRRVLPDLPEDAYWIEPQARGTCPVLAWAAWEIHKRDPDAVMVSLHADHRVEPLTAFVETISTAVDVARRHDLLLCLGAQPSRVETGYGHVEPGEPLSAEGAQAFRVGAFHEKPDADTAQRYVDEGYLWNTGIFVWKAARFLEEVERHAPEVAACLPLLEQGPEAFFAEVPVCVVDRAVMERSDRVGTVRATFEWDDVGAWCALGRMLAPDADGNVRVGNAEVIGGSGNVVYVEDGRVALFGVDDLVVVRVGDTTMVVPKERAGELKNFLADLEETPP